jgi:hypothetical protein
MVPFYKIKGLFLSVFREIFVYHHSSLEFRAKLLAAFVSANEAHGECEKEIVIKSAKKIYQDDVARVEVLTNTTYEFVKKILDGSIPLRIEDLLKDIERSIKKNERFLDKIYMDDLKEFLNCTQNEDIEITMIRILEFLEYLKIEYTKMEED